MVDLGLRNGSRESRVDHIFRIYEKTISRSFLYLVPAKTIRKVALQKKYKKKNYPVWYHCGSEMEVETVV